MRRSPLLSDKSRFMMHWIVKKNKFGIIATSCIIDKETTMNQQLKREIQKTIAGWHHYLTTNQAEDLKPLFSEDIVFRSPVAFTPYPGIEAITLVLTTVNTVFKDFTYHREFYSADGLNLVLEFSAHVDGKQLKGIDMLRFDESGKIVEFEVMVRPASGLMALKEAMQEKLLAHSAILANKK